MQCVNSLHQHTYLTSYSIGFVISADIVNTINGDPFFPDEELLNTFANEYYFAAIETISLKTA